MTKAVNMTCRVFILDVDQPGLLKGMNPDAIGREYPLWQPELRKLGPWRQWDTPEFRLWRADYYGEGNDGPAVWVVPSCASTMDVAWHLIRKHFLTPWDSVVAVEQTAGRGQRKRQWVSPVGNLHASWCWPLPGNTGTGNWDGLASLLAGFVICRGLAEAGVETRIKWPNDLLMNDRKFGGILVEQRAGLIVVGVGINLRDAPDNDRLRAESAVPATHLQSEGLDRTPLQLWLDLMEHAKGTIESLVQSLSPAQFVRLIESRMVWIGRTVRVRPLSDEVFTATVLGLAEDGGLRVKRGNLEEVLYSGSIIPA